MGDGGPSCMEQRGPFVYGEKRPLVYGVRSPQVYAVRVLLVYRDPGVWGKGALDAWQKAPPSVWGGLAFDIVHEEDRAEHFEALDALAGDHLCGNQITSLGNKVMNLRGTLSQIT